MIRATGLGHRYGRSADWTFRDVDVTIPAGEVLAVLGPNARGKTTLVSTLAGLRVPASGEVEREGHVGFVPQSHASAFAFPVREVVLMGRARHVRAMSTPGKHDREIADAALERIGISHLADRSYPRLSGGERQLVLIARALASECSSMVLDEPASALDLRNQARVLRVLRSLADEGMAIVMTTHHPDHAFHIAERSLLIVGPDDVRVGATGELLTEELLSELYGLGMQTADVTTPSALRRLIVPDFGPAVPAAWSDAARPAPTVEGVRV
ncbi:ABC transporter ATP-binding protein [Leucobacter sp. cx-328]|uniref:ABC transporter ATP-binding protein n=1 Tax=unclassified Leucobacter TaxID=2621730 RepID=UPI00165E1912|nr:MULTISPECIES: ABC transporter ATP-binding protein [unclassified Leucobacter]MBC9943137.1 ABC transporter ATP-binding protein [Leucobacter sp. cx-328]